MPIERVYDGKGMDAKTLAAIEPFCISYHGVSRANVKEGDKVLVVGAGTIGVLAAIAAQGQGRVCLHFRRICRKAGDGKGLWRRRNTFK